MSDAALRSRLIRLAHANPDLRADLLPLLEKQAGQIPPGMSLIEVLTSFLEQGITRAMGRVGVEVSFNPPPKLMVVVDEEDFLHGETTYTQTTFEFDLVRSTLVAIRGDVRKSVPFNLMFSDAQDISKAVTLLVSRLPSGFRQNDTPSLGDRAPNEYFTERFASKRKR